MLTVMHRHDGIEEYHVASSVMFRSASAPGEEPTEALALRLAGRGDDPTLFLHGGTAFVMNEQGATVGRYHLPPSEISKSTGQ